MMEKVTQTIPSKDGTIITYDKRGKGDALIFVGGAFQYRALDQSTTQLAEILADNFTTYHYDRRGRGDSTDIQPYSKEREIEDLQALMTAAGGSAYVFGMSSGAALALDTAAMDKSALKLALYEPPFIVDDSRPAIPDNYLAHVKQLVQTGKHGDAVEYAMTNAALIPHEVIAGMRQSPVWPAFEAVAKTIAYDGEFVADLMQGQELPADVWASLSQETLVLAGGDSPVWLLHAAKATALTLAHGEFRILESQTHDVQPEVLAPVLKSYFKA